MARVYQLAILGQPKLIFDREEIEEANTVVLTPVTCVLDNEHNKLPALVMKSAVIVPLKVLVM